jgi:hypothetical protein
MFIKMRDLIYNYVHLCDIPLEKKLLRRTAGRGRWIARHFQSWHKTIERKRKNRRDKRGSFEHPGFAR